MNDEEAEEEDEEEVNDEEAEEDDEEAVADDNEEDDEEEFEEVEDIEIDGVMYLTTDKENGEIYKCDEDGEIMEDDEGEFIKAGYFKDGISFIL